MQQNCGCTHGFADVIEGRIAGSDHLLSKLMDAHEWVKRERQENDTLRIVLQLLRFIYALPPYLTSPHLTCTEPDCLCPTMH